MNKLSQKFDENQLIKSVISNSVNQLISNEFGLYSIIYMTDRLIN